MRRALLLGLACLTGCQSWLDYFTSSLQSTHAAGDEYPINVDTNSGAIVVGIQPAGDLQYDAVLDVLSPITIVDHGATAPPTIQHSIDLTIFGTRQPDGPLDLPRAEFTNAQVVTLHPCGSDACDVGTPAAPRAFGGILGMDAFAVDTLRLHLDRQQIYILPAVGGSNDADGTEAARSAACDAVLPAPFHGGGTMLVGGTEVPFSPWRIAIAACLAPDPDPALVSQSLRGADALLVASTGIGTTLLGEAAYLRYQAVVGKTVAPDLDQLQLGYELLPAGPISGRIATISSLALVGNTTNPAISRSPCRQVFAHHLLAQRDCTLDDFPAGNCPCGNTGALTPRCGVPAIVELAPPKPIAVLVIPDTDSTLQALRAELRPALPELDGILGTSALAGLELDIEYANNRLLARCSDTTQCTARPELSGDQNELIADRVQVDGCLGITPP